MLILWNSIWNTVNYETTVSSSLVLKTYILSKIYHRILNVTYKCFCNLYNCIRKLD